MHFSLVGLLKFARHTREMTRQWKWLVNDGQHYSTWPGGLVWYSSRNLELTRGQDGDGDGEGDDGLKVSFAFEAALVYYRSESSWVESSWGNSFHFTSFPASSSPPPSSCWIYKSTFLLLLLSSYICRAYLQLLLCDSNSVPLMRVEKAFLSILAPN